MQKYGLTAEKAFDVLRRYSQQQNRKLVAVADQLISTGTLPDWAPEHPNDHQKSLSRRATGAAAAR